jgi:hypothetical protein
MPQGTVTLQEIALLHVPAVAGQPARLALEIAGDHNGVSLLIGAGSAPDLDRLLEDDPLDQSLRQAALGADSGLWFGTGVDATIAGGIPDRPVWFAVVRGNRTDVLGIQPVQPTLGVAGVLDVEGRCALRTRLSLVGGSVVRAECTLTGTLRFRADLGPLRLANAAASFRLTAATASLDRAWQGTLACDVDTRGGMRVFGVDVAAQQAIHLEARCHAAAGAATFVVDAIDYTHTLSGIRFGNGTVAVEALTLTSSLGGWDAAGFASFEASGAGTVTLPAAFGPAVAGSPGRLEAAVTLRCVRQGGAYATSLLARLRGLRLPAAVNPLGFSAAAVSLRIDGADIRLDASLRQSWSQAAVRLRNAGVVQLPEAAWLPDLACGLRIERAGAGVRVALTLDVLGTGQLWVMPWAIADWQIRLVATVVSGVWSWRAEGTGRVSTLEPLAAIVPLDRAQCTFSLAVVAGQPPLLRLTAAGNLPGIALPPFRRGDAPLRILQPVSVEMSLSASFTVSVRVRLLPNLAGIAAAAGLPADWDDFLWPLVGAVGNAIGTLTISLPAAGTGGARLALTLQAPQNAPAFDPLRAFARILPAPPPAAQASHASPPLLTVKPRALSFTADLPATGEPSLELTASAICSVLGETFDAHVGFGVRQGSPEATILAAHHDPILIRIPSPGNGALLATLDADFDRVMAMFAITSGSRRTQMQGIRQQLAALFGDEAHDTLMAFEVVDLAIAFRAGAAADPISLSGGIRLVQYPPVLDCLLGGPSPTLTLGTSGSSFFVEIAPAGAQPEPLATIPVANRGHIKVFLHNLRIGYRWDPPAVEFALASTIDSPTLPFNGGVGLLLPPQSTIDIAIAAPTPPPFPIPQWRADFIGQDRQPANRGIELVFGQSEQNRALTIYLRETVLSPTFYFLMPGFKIDGGAYLGARPQDRGPLAFHCEFRLGGAQLITMSPVMGLMLNPLAALPPFLTANPPFWVVGPSLMGDFFTDSSGATGIEFSANLPLLAGFDVVFKRPLPSITLQMLLEIAALAAQEFAVEIPANSSLKNLFYAELTGSITLHALSTLFGTSHGSVPASVRFNIVDLINGLLRLIQSGKDAVEAGAQAAQKALDLAGRALADPELIVRMVPRHQRGFAADTVLAVPGFGFACHLSAYLLLPDELEAELLAYHENKRKKGKGLGALREAPGGPGVASSNVDWDIFDRVDRKRVANAGEWTGDKLIARIHKQAATRLSAATAAPVKALEEQLATTAAAEVVPALLNARTAAARLAVLRSWTIEAVHPQIERTLASSRRPADELAPLIRRAVRTAATMKLEVRATLPDTSARMAESLVDAAFEIAPTRRVTVRAGRRQPIRQVGRTKILGTRLERSVDKAIADRLPDRPLNRSELAAWRAETTRLLQAEVEAASLVGVRPNVPVSRAGSIVLELASPAFDLDSLTRADLRPVEDRLAVFRGRHWNDGLGRFLNLRDRIPGSPVADGRAEERNGYVIRARADFRRHAPDFAVQVPARNARFQVRLQGGAYRVIVPGQTPAAIPAALVNTLPPTPDRARRLRALLVIEENRSTRTLTNADRTYLESDPIVTIPGLYQSTLFARPEYQIKSRGGVRGSTSLADLLRRPDGTYDVPDGPCLIAGAKVRLRIGGLDFEAQFCGYVSPGRSSPARPPMMLLFAHSEQTIAFGPFSFQLKGGFHLLAGRDSFTFGGETLAQGIGFSGSATLYHGSRKVLSGEATTKASVKSGSRLQLTLAVKLHLDIAFDDLEIAGVELAKGWIKQDLELEFLLGSHLAASLSMDVDFRYKTKVLEWRDEEYLACVGIGRFRHCERFSVPVPYLVWGPELRAKASLHVAIDTSRSNPALTLKVSVPSIGLNNLEIPDFFTEIA